MPHSATPLTRDVSATAAPSDAAGPAFARRPRTYFDLILAAYCVILVLSNIGATKGVEFGPIITDGGFFLFPLAYVLGDVVTEVYGFKAARKAIITSFVFGAFSSAVFWIVIILPPAEFYENQSAFEAVLGPVPPDALLQQHRQPILKALLDVSIAGEARLAAAEKPAVMVSSASSARRSTLVMSSAGVW